MHRIDKANAQADKHGAGKDGFTEGNPSTGTEATTVSADIMDAIQEEVCTVIEDPTGGNATLVKANNSQLLDAIKSMDAAVMQVADGNHDHVSITGNAGTATRLESVRNIGNVAFNGTNSIVPETIDVITTSSPGTSVLLANGGTGAQRPKTNPNLTVDLDTGHFNYLGGRFFQGSPLEGVIDESYEAPIADVRDQDTSLAGHFVSAEALHSFIYAGIATIDNFTTGAASIAGGPNGGSWSASWNNGAQEMTITHPIGSSALITTIGWFTNNAGRNAYATVKNITSTTIVIKVFGAIDNGDGVHFHCIYYT